jgi:hypothetical protein
MRVATAKVRTSGLKIGRLAFRELMNVNGVFAGRKVLNVESDLNAFGSGAKNSGADALALDVFDVNSDRLGVGMSFLSDCSAARGQKQSGTQKSFHANSPHG